MACKHQQFPNPMKGGTNKTLSDVSVLCLSIQNYLTNVHGKQRQEKCKNRSDSFSDGNKYFWGEKNPNIIYPSSSAWIPKNQNKVMGMLRGNGTRWKRDTLLRLFNWKAGSTCILVAKTSLFLLFHQLMELFTEQCLVGIKVILYLFREAALSKDLLVSWLANDVLL